jgi:hypothetical protein
VVAIVSTISTRTLTLVISTPPCRSGANARPRLCGINTFEAGGRTLM